MTNEEVEKMLLSWMDEAVEETLDKLWSTSGEPSFREDIIKRFRQGRRRFGGDFNINATDWNAERREELIDAVIYSVFSMLKQKGGDQ